MLISDLNWLNTNCYLPPQGCTIAVDEVQELQNYILHIGQVQELTVKVGDRVTLDIDKVSEILPVSRFQFANKSSL